MSRRRGILRNASGFTVTEVMISMGLIMVFAVGLTQVLYDNTKASRTIALTNEFENLMTNVQQVISAESSCRGFLQSRVPGGNLTPAGPFPIDLQEVSFPGGPVVTRVTPVGEKGRVNVTKIELTQVEANLNPLPDGNQEFIVRMTIEAERLVGEKNDKGIGHHKVTRTFPITVVHDAGGAIVNCYQDPRLIDICTSLNGRANSNGVACDLGQEICRQLGGAYTAGNVPPCDYSPGGGAGPTPPTNVTERVCLDMGGTYTGGVPACRFDANSDTGATSVQAICASMGGVLMGGAPARCDFCAANGATWNANLNGGLGGCDFAQKACEGRRTVAQPVIYDPITQSCDSTAADCDRLGGQILGGRCQIPVEYNNCFNHSVGTLDWGGRGNVLAPPDTYGWGCPDGYYVQNLSGSTKRTENDERDGFNAQIRCCRVNP